MNVVPEFGGTLPVKSITLKLAVPAGTTTVFVRPVREPPEAVGVIGVD